MPSPSRFLPTTPTRQIARIRSLARDLGRSLHRLDWAVLDTVTRQRLAQFLLPLHSALSLAAEIARLPHSGKPGQDKTGEPSLTDDLPVFRRPRDP